AKAVETLVKHPEPGMPTLHEEIFDKIKALAPESPTVKRLQTLMQKGADVQESPLQAALESSAPQVEMRASGSGGGTKEGSWTGTEPDDAWTTTSAIQASQDRHFDTKSATAPKPDLPLASAPSEPSKANADPDAVRAPHSKERAHSTKEQFQAYIQAGKRAEAEQWLGQFGNEQPNDVEAHELLGSLREDKGDGPAAALQYSRALELLLAHPDDKKPDRPVVLYDKIKELAPASPFLAKVAPMFAPKPDEPLTVAAAAGDYTLIANGFDPDVHYTLGVAYKNMGLLDEAKEEFAQSMKGNDLF